MLHSPPQCGQPSKARGLPGGRGEAESEASKQGAGSWADKTGPASWSAEIRLSEPMTDAGVRGPCQKASVRRDDLKYKSSVGRAHSKPTYLPEGTGIQPPKFRAARITGSSQSMARPNAPSKQTCPKPTAQQPGAAGRASSPLAAPHYLPGSGGANTAGYAMGQGCSRA